MGNVARWTEPLTEWDVVLLADDDFVNDVDANILTTTATDSGTALVGDGAKGVITLLPSDGSVADNDEIYISKPNECALFAAGKPIYARALMQYAEGNTDDLNVIFGLMNAPVADSLVDDGGGPRASGSLAVIYKVDGGTVWRVQSRNGSEVTDTISTTTAGGSAYQTLEILVHDYTPTRCQITYKVDGQFLKDSSGKVIVHQLLVASATEMSLMAGAKNGAGSTVESLKIDRWYGHQQR